MTDAQSSDVVSDSEAMPAVPLSAINCLLHRWISNLIK